MTKDQEQRPTAQSQELPANGQELPASRTAALIELLHTAAGQGTITLPEHDQRVLLYLGASIAVHRAGDPDDVKRALRNLEIDIWTTAPLLPAATRLELTRALPDPERITAMVHELIGRVVHQSAGAPLLADLLALHGQHTAPGSML